MHGTFRSWYLLFGTVLWLAPAAISSGTLFAQQGTPFLMTDCAASVDCTSYMWDFGLLLQRDVQLVAIRGKRPENRSHILSQAGSYLTAHYRVVDSAEHFRYLSCVSNALWSERGENRTLFSSENIIETYFALADRGAETSLSIPHACAMLKAYHSRFEQAREESNILQKKAIPDPQFIWHSILLDFARERTPKRDAEASVRRLQERYCLFAMECRSTENSPFAGK